MKSNSNIESKPFIELLRDDIVRRALRLWKAAGRPAGRDLEFWLQAEMELASKQLRKSVRKVSTHSMGCFDLVKL